MRRTGWVRWLLVPLVVLPIGWLLLSGFGRDPMEISSPLIGQPAPEWTLTTLDGETLSSADLAGRPYVVNFWASWCGPCVRFAPTYEKSSEKHTEITFGKVDTEAEQAIAAKFDIRSIPTIMAIRDGVIVFSQPGALPESALESLIDQVEKLDMEDVRKQLAAHNH